MIYETPKIGAIDSSGMQTISLLDSKDQCYRDYKAPKEKVDQFIKNNAKYNRGSFLITLGAIVGLAGMAMDCIFSKGKEYKELASLIGFLMEGVATIIETFGIIDVLSASRKTNKLKKEIINQ